MGGAERVVDVNIGQLCQLFGEVVLCLAKLAIFLGGFVLYGLFLVKAQILKQHTVAWL